MSFLAPLFLIAGLAIGLPIIFHLIRRTTRDKTRFSSLMFLVPTPPRVTRRSRLENIWLLLLRCLVLVLLAFAFARPFFQRPLAALPDSAKGKWITLLVDTSASMRREDLWAMAKEWAEAFLNQVAAVDQVAVFSFDTQTRPLLTFEEWARMNPSERLAAVRDRLGSTNPGWAGTDLGNALINGVEAMEEAAKRDDKQTVSRSRQVVVITDLQEGSRLQSLQAFEWPHGLEVLVEQVKVKHPTNAGLQLVMDTDESVKEGPEVGPRIRVSNSSESRREQFQLRWSGQSQATLKPLEIYVPPGQSRIIQMPLNTNGLAPETTLNLTGDDQEFDNNLFVVQPKPEQITLLYFGNEAADDSTQPLYYLRKALQKTRRQSVEIRARRPSAPLTESDWNRAHVAIVTGPPTENEIESLQRFMKEGRTVLVAMKDAPAVQSLARLLGIEAPASAESPNTSGYAMLGEINFEHPLFTAFADPRFSDFTKVHFWKHRRVELDKVPNARILSRFDNGDIAFAEIPVGQGRLLILTSGWQPSDSQLALSSKFVPLLYSILEQSGDVRERPPQYLVGEAVRMSASATNTDQIFKIQKPDNAVAEVKSGQKFSETILPGIYTITAPQSTQQFAVNLDSQESRTAPLSMDDLERLGAPVKHHSPEVARELEKRRVQLHNSELENRQKLWRWCLLAALFFLLIETLIAGLMARRAASPASA